MVRSLWFLTFAKLFWFAAPVLLFPSGSVTTINENYDTSGGPLIWQAQSSDFDDDKNPEYNIVSQSVNGTFVFEGTRLVTYATLDYEETPSYEVTIR